MALDLNRMPTNTVSIRVLIVFIVVWLISGLIVIIPGGKYTFSLPDYFNITNTTLPVKPVEKASAVTGIIATLITAMVGFAIALSYIYLVRSFSRCAVYVAIVMLWIYVIMFGLETILFLYIALKQPLSLLMVVILVCLILFFGFIIKNIGTVGIDTLERIVKKSCSAVTYYPKCHVFTLLGMSCEGLLSYFTVLVFINSDGSTLCTISLTLNTIAGTWIAAFILSIDYLILSTAFVTCKIDETATSSDIDSNVSSIMKTHVGTVAYGCSPLSIKTQITALLGFPLQPLTFALGLATFLFTSSFRSMSFTLTIMQGTDFGESIKKAFELIFQAPLRWFILFVVSPLAVLSGAIILTGFYASVVIGVVMSTALYNYLIPIWIATIIPFVIMFSTMNTAVYTLITCDLYDDYASVMPI